MAGNLVVGRLRALLSLDSAEFVDGVRKSGAGLAGFEKGLQSFGKSSTAIGQAMLPISAGLAAIGGGSIKMATDLNAALANVSALLTNVSGPALDSAVGDMKTKVQALAVELGKSTGDISGGLYEVVSSLGLTKDSFAQLEIAAKAGAAGLASTQESFSFLSAVTKTYGDTSAEAFTKVADLGFQAVNIGQTTFPALAASIGSVAPIAQVAGVTLEELFAVIATATGVTGNTAEVTTQMASAINALLNPSADLVKAMDSLGVASGKALIEELGLVGSLQAVAKYSAETDTPLAKLLGRKEAFIITASLAGEQAGKFAENMVKMGEAANASGGIVDDAFAKQTEGVNKAGFAWSQFKSQLQVAAEQLGDALIPAVLDAAAALKPMWEAVLTAVQWFTQLPAPVKNTAVAIGAILIVAAPVALAIGALAVAATAIGIPFIAGAAAVAGLTAAAYLVWKAVQVAEKNIIASATAIYTGVKNFLGDQLTNIFNGIGVAVDKVKAYFRDLYTAVVGRSYIPDMVDGIEAEMLRLDTVMVGPAAIATQNVSASFAAMADSAVGSTTRWDDAIGDLAKSFTQLATIAGDSFGGILQGIGTVVSAMQMAAQASDQFQKGLAAWRGGDTAGGLAGMVGGGIGGISALMAGTASGNKGQNVLGGAAAGAKMGMAAGPYGAAIGAGVGALVGWIRSNGASDMELAGREIADKFRQGILAGLTTDQMKAVHEATQGAWKGNETGAATLIAVSDAYRKMGFSAEQAADVVHRLWLAEKQGGMAVKIVLGEIDDVLSGPIVDATTAATEAGVWGFGRVSERLTAVRLEVGDAGGEFGRLEIAMQDAAAAGVTDFSFMAGEIDRMKAGISAPIHIPISMSFQEVSQKSDERAWAAGASEEQIRAAAASFTERNQGDAHRLGSALGLSLDQLKRAGVPGFAGGTPWLAPLDFGAGSLALLHGQESIVPAGREGAFAAQHGQGPAVADILRTEFAHMRQVLPTMVMVAVRDQLQLGARRG